MKLGEIPTRMTGTFPIEIPVNVDYIMTNLYRRKQEISAYCCAVVASSAWSFIVRVQYSSQAR